MYKAHCRDCTIQIQTTIPFKIEYPEEYYRYCNCEIEGPKYDAIYENYTPEDSFERFKYWMNEIIPNTYKSQTEEFWEKLYDYYQVNSWQYGS